MTEDDGKLTRKYRELAGEEPPPSLDAAILAASRRAVRSRPASQRWAAPVSIAALLMLSVGVVINIQQEQPGIETSEPTRRIEVPEAPRKADAPAPAPAESAVTAPAPASPAPLAREPASTAAPGPAPAPAPAMKFRADKSLLKDAAPPPAVPKEERAQIAPAPENAPAAPAASAAEAFRPEPRPFAQSNLAGAASAPASPATAPATAPPPPMARDSAEAPRAAAPQLRAKRETADAVMSVQKSVGVPLHDPAAELERIARLRGESRHEEADKALAEFQRKFPGYRIPDAVWDRVKPR